MSKRNNLNWKKGFGEGNFKKIQPLHRRISIGFSAWFCRSSASVFRSGSFQRRNNGRRGSVGNYQTIRLHLEFCFGNDDVGVADLGRKTEMAQRIFTRTIFRRRDNFSRHRHSFTASQLAWFDCIYRGFGGTDAVVFLNHLFSQRNPRLSFC